MSEPDFGRWQELESAPRDGTRILVELRASEQGPAEVDMVRWAKPDRAGEPCWVSTDSDPGVPIVYAEAELAGWMALPSPLPRLRAGSSKRVNPDDFDEIGGSGI